MATLTHGRWLHEDCAEDCIVDSDENKYYCPFCVDLLTVSQCFAYTFIITKITSIAIVIIKISYKMWAFMLSVFHGLSLGLSEIMWI